MLDILNLVVLRDWQTGKYWVSKRVACLVVYLAYVQAEKRVS